MIMELGEVNSRAMGLELITQLHHPGQAALPRRWIPDGPGGGDPRFPERLSMNKGCCG